MHPLEVLEKVVHRQIYKHLESSGALSTSQFGFRRGHSRSDLLLSVVDDWLSARDSKLCTAIVFLGLSKAFDNVDHESLLLLRHRHPWRFTTKMQRRSGKMFTKLEKLCSGFGAVKERRKCAGWDTSVIGAEAQEVYMTCTWTDPADAEKINPVLKQFQEYCEPKKNLSFEQYCFNQRQQQPEELYDQYNSALKKLAEGCAFSIASITPDKILRDRLVFGIADDKVRERQLRESDLTLKKTDKLCHAAERMTAQLKVVADKEATTEAANAVSTGRNTSKTKTQTTRGRRRKEVDCSGYCGQRHEMHVLLMANPAPIVAGRIMLPASAKSEHQH